MALKSTQELTRKTFDGLGEGELAPPHMDVEWTADPSDGVQSSLKLEPDAQRDAALV